MLALEERLNALEPAASLEQPHDDVVPPLADVSAVPDVKAMPLNAELIKR